jgi:hypothetical protein
MQKLKLFDSEKNSLKNLFLTLVHVFRTFKNTSVASDIILHESLLLLYHTSEFVDQKNL